MLTVTELTAAQGPLEALLSRCSGETEAENMGVCVTCLPVSWIVVYVVQPQ